MTESSPFDHIFEQIADLMRFAVENADKELTKDIPKDVERKLKELTMKVEEFNQLETNVISSMGYTKEEIDNLMAKAEIMRTKNEKRLFDKLKELEAQAKKKMEKLAKLEKERNKQATPSEAASLSEEEKKKSILKRLSGRKNWRRL